MDDIAKHYPGLSDLQAKAAEWGALTTETTKGYEGIRLAIAECRGARVAVEAKRKELKAESLEFGRRVDSTASRDDLIWTVRMLYRVTRNPELRRAMWRWLTDQGERP